MTRAEAVQQLEARMTAYLSEFFSNNEDLEEACSVLGYVGEDLNRLMAKAAMSVWESSMDIQEFLVREGMLTE